MSPFPDRPSKTSPKLDFSFFYSLLFRTCSSLRFHLFSQYIFAPSFVRRSFSVGGVPPFSSQLMQGTIRHANLTGGYFAPFVPSSLRPFVKQNTCKVHPSHKLARKPYRRLLRPYPPIFTLKPAFSNNVLYFAISSSVSSFTPFILYLIPYL